MTGDVRGYRLSPLAVSDLEDIWRYTLSRWSAAQADRYVDQVFAAIQALCDGTARGRPATVRDGYYRAGVGSHVLFYRLDEQSLDVIRILHVRMDVDRHI